MSKLLILLKPRILLLALAILSLLAALLACGSDPTATRNPTRTPTPPPQRALSAPANTPTPRPTVAIPFTDDTETAALIALFRATDGDNWDDNANWLSAASIGEWAGVTTNSSGSVTELDLSDNNLTGTLPPDLAELDDLEVLLLHDRVDEWVVAHLDAFDGKPLQSVAQGDLDLGQLADSEADARQQKETEDEFKPLVERVRKALGSKASDVRLTHRLTESPACLVSAEDGMSANLQRVLRATGQAVPDVPLVLELNPAHPIVTRLGDEPDEARFKDWSHILFDQAMLAEGGQLDDPAGFVKRLNELMLALAGAPKSRLWTPGSQ